MTKLYNTEIANWSTISVFDDIRDSWIEDEETGLWYTKDKGDFDWWQELANAIDFLEENGIDAEINELNDYITIAQANGMN